MASQKGSAETALGALLEVHEESDVQEQLAAASTVKKGACSTALLSSATGCRIRHYTPSQPSPAQSTKDQASPVLLPPAHHNSLDLL